MLRRIELIVTEGDAKVTFTTFCGHSQHDTIRALLGCVIANGPNPAWIDAIEDGTMYAANDRISGFARFDTTCIDLDGPAEHEFYCFWLLHDVGAAQKLLLSEVPELPNSDVTISVCREEIRSSRSYLSAHSKYFAEALEKDDHVAVPDVDPSKFAEFLLAIYPQQRKITAANVATLTRLASCYEATHLSDKCVKFLLMDTSMNLLDKIFLSDEMDMHDVRKQLILRMSASDVNEVAFGDPDLVSLQCRDEVFKQAARMLNLGLTENSGQPGPPRIPKSAVNKEKTQQEQCRTT